MNVSMFGRAVCTLAFGWFACSNAALAQTSTAFSIDATCTGGGQLCNNVASVNVTTAGLLQAQFTLGSGACSNVRIHWLVDGTEIAVSGFVGPGVSTAVSNLGPVSAGPHVVGLRAEGQVGGCNQGTLASWGGTALITTQAIIVALSPVATPTLGEWGLAALGILLGFAAVCGLRSRRK